MTILESILIDKIGLTFEEFSVVNPFVQKRLLKKKELIIKAGDTCSFIGFLESGTLRSYVLKNGAEFNVDFYFPGSIVSAYTSFLEQKPTNGFIQTISESVLYTLPYSDFQTLLKQDTRYYKIARYIAETLFIKKCKREKSLLMDSANERYKYLLGLYPTIEQDVPQYHIASYLGIKPESLSRIKSLTYINEKDGS